MRKMSWRKLPVSLTELCLDTTLRCGQSFRSVKSLCARESARLTTDCRWRKSEDNIWSCALHGRILSLRQDSTQLHYQAVFPDTCNAPPTPPSSVPSSEYQVEEDDTEDLVRHYLNLGPSLVELYEQWSSADLNFKKKAPKFTGVRNLKQDAWEALIGFICSSNNNIIRISQMVQSMDPNFPTMANRVATTDGQAL